MSRGLPNWTRDEIILAIELYHRHGGKVLDKSHKDVVELSEMLRRLPIHPPEVRGPKFRNPTGVARKLGNIQSVDPNVPARGSENGGHLTEKVFEEIGNDIERVRHAAAAIRAMIDGDQEVVESHSWKIINDAVATKRLDKSSFKYHGTGIPGDIRPFFQAETLAPGDKKDIELQFAGKAIPAYIQIDPFDRARLFWDPSFTSMFKGALPGWAEALNADIPPSDAGRPIMRFARAESDDAFVVAIVCPESIRMDAEAEQEEEQGPRAEGAVKVYYGKRYERDPKNRSRAIEIHGEKCVVCGFDFGRVYGARGIGFIEVHHNKPLHTVDGEHVVDPETDLMPVCANCHRMLHRRKDDVLTVQDLKALLQC